MRTSDKVEKPAGWSDAAWAEHKKGARRMVCPHCGHEAISYGIGAVWCGPHGRGSDMTPCVRMRETEL